MSQHRWTCWRGPWALGLAVAVCSSGASAARPVWTEVAATVLPIYQRSDQPLLTGGAAVGDCDGDGWPDVYFPAYAEHFLFRNRGDGAFEDFTVAANLTALAQGDFFTGRGAAFGDIDNDGDLDLFVTGYAQARHWLFVNSGACWFTEEADARGVRVDSAALGRSVSFGDYDRDGYLDLFVTEVWSPMLGGVAPPVVSHLFRNRGAAAPGYYEDLTRIAGVALDHVPGSQPGIFPFTPRFADFDRDGWPDIAVASDFGQSRLFWNNGDGTFTDGTASAGVGTDEYGMGAVTADFDGDGWLDWFVTSIYLAGRERGTGNRLYRYSGSRRFEDRTSAAGVRDGMWGWGTAALDYDNDGDVDLAMTNGVQPGDAELYAELEFGPVDLTPFFADPARFWENRGDGTFDEVAGDVGFFDRGAGQGLIAFDYDGDGDLDLLLTHDHGVLPLLFRNDGGNAANWIDIQLRGQRSNSQGIGAWVVVTTSEGRHLSQEVSASSTYFAQDGSGVAHFGLGTAERARAIEVHWPSGLVERWFDATAGRRHLLQETTGCRSAAPEECRPPTVAPPTETPPAPSTPEPTATPQPTAAMVCPGDCNGDGSVTIEELVFLVRVALELEAIGDCRSGDGNSDGQVTIEEILQAVRVALFGCVSPRDTGSAARGGWPDPAFSRGEGSSRL